MLGERLAVLDLELPSDRIVVEGPLTTGHRHVESGEVAAAGAPVPDGACVGGHAGQRTGQVIPFPSTIEHMFATLERVAVTHAPRQRSFDDLGRPLAEVTFVVLDLETTGTSPATCAITEVGAVKVRGGEVLGTFQTLVNPGLPIPPSITVLTGITHAMVVPAPPVGAVLDPFSGFVGDAVIVGHNVAFDLRFLRAAMEEHGYPRFTNTVVDTCALARRLVRDEVPNCRLATLADLFRVGRKPTHRALDDAWATMEVLHALLERAGSLGVLGLDD